MRPFWEQGACLEFAWEYALQQKLGVAVVVIRKQDVGVTCATGFGQHLLDNRGPWFIVEKGNHGAGIRT